jgi:hypothetical protein
MFVLRNSLLAALVTLLGSGQIYGALIFSENFGTPSGTTAIASYTGWQNPSLTFTGTADIRSTSASSGYSGSSGSGNVFWTNGTATARTFTIAGIDTSGFVSNSFDISFGAIKTVSASNFSDFSLSFSSDGVNFTGITLPTQASGSGTNVWRLISVNALTLPTVSNLRLRFSQVGVSSNNYRIDDFALNGVAAVPEPTSMVLVGLMGVAGVAVRARRRLAKTA